MEGPQCKQRAVQVRNFPFGEKETCKGQPATTQENHNLAFCELFPSYLFCDALLSDMENKSPLPIKEPLFVSKSLLLSLINQ